MRVNLFSIHGEVNVDCNPFIPSPISPACLPFPDTPRRRNSVFSLGSGSCFFLLPTEVWSLLALLFSAESFRRNPHLAICDSSKYCIRQRSESTACDTHATSEYCLTVRYTGFVLNRGNGCFQGFTNVCEFRGSLSLLSWPQHSLNVRAIAKAPLTVLKYILLAILCTWSESSFALW